MLLHFLSHPNPYIGFGVHALQLHRQLSELAGPAGIHLHATDLGRGLDTAALEERIRALPTGTPVVHLLLGDGRSSHQILDRLQGLKVTYTVFESDTLPLGWKENLERSDLVLTASEWGAEILRRELDDTPVAVVPEGVDPWLHHQWNRPTDQRSWRRDAGPGTPIDDCFRLLCVGKFESRKSYRELIEAFARAFPDRPDVRLLLRLHNVFSPDYARELQPLLARDDLGGRVLIVGGAEGAEQLSAETMAHLYRSSHGFVFPSKGEGWGLPLLEAIACGTPFIACDYGGQTEYLRHCRQSFSTIAHRLVTIREPDFLRFHQFAEERPARWAQPDVADLARQMRALYDSWPAVRQQAILNARTVHRRFSWAASAETLIDVLAERLLRRPDSLSGGGFRASEQAGPPWDPDQETPQPETLLALLGRRRATFALCHDELRALPAPRVLELGTTRSFCSGRIDTHHYLSDPRLWDWGGGCGTYVLPALLPGCRLESVDPSQEALSVARRLCRRFSDRIRFLATDSSSHLSSCAGEYDLIYMDHGETSPETAELHRRDAALIVERGLLRPGGLILFDDQEFADGQIGKGARAIPYLLSQGFTLISDPGSYQALLRAPAGEPAGATTGSAD